MVRKWLRRVFRDRIGPLLDEDPPGPHPLIPRPREGS